jgi:hypothetical protein
MQYSLAHQLGKRSGGLDPDAKAYIAATGATDTKAINDFVKGIKSLGYWPYMVCWPMRSSQNYGTGTVVGSLGGYGSYPATLVNGPTWGANGITCTHGANQSATVSVPTVFPRSMQLFSDFDNLTIGTSGVSTTYGANYSSGGYSGSFGVNSFLQKRFQIRNSSSTDGVLNYSTTGIHSASAIIESGSQELFVNNSTSAAVTSSIVLSGTENTNIARIIGLNTMTGSGGSILVAISIAFEGVLVDHVSVYNLYKSTLGNGLGLP